MRKLIKNSTVYHCGKSETNCFSTGLHYDETGEKTIYCGHKLSAYNKHFHLVSYLISSCGNNHNSNVIICYSFNGQIINV